MKRVAALYLPMWPVERLRRAERTAAPPEARGAIEPLLAPLGEVAMAEQENACSVPRGGGWRPGARWAREDAATLRAKKRESGRREEAAKPAFHNSSPSSLGEGDHAKRGGGAAVEHRRLRGGPSTVRFAAGPPPRDELGEDLSVPLILTQRTGNRVLLSAACPRARAEGLRPGMALTQARALVPGLDIRPADPDADRAALRSLAIAFARRWSPIVAADGDDGLFLDLTGVAHLFGGEAAMARRIVRLLARLGFTAHLAVADTAGAAHAIARCAPGITLCPPGRQRTAIADLPPSALRIDPDAAELLLRLGVDRIGTLAAMPRGPLVRRFGEVLAARLDQALGMAPEPLDGVVPPQMIAVGRRFAEPIGTADAIAHWLGRLVPELVQALAEAGRGARLVELACERVDASVQRVSVGLARASRDPAHLVRLLARRIETIDPGFGIDAITLHVRRSEPLGAEPFAERLDTETVPDLAPLVDTLATRIGLSRLWRAEPVESDVPERSVARGGVLDPPARPQPRLKLDSVEQLAQAPLAPWHARWPRPARLLRRPERIDDVLALLPDQPPRRFTWRGVTHRIVRADGPERIHGEWWRRAAEAQAARDYFRVEDEEGRRYWLFRRGDGERAVTGDLSWYLHGVFG